jgi:hypothetical protein
MPLDKTAGEPIPALGPHYVVPVQDYSREPAFHQALDHAKQKFKDAGARHEIEFGPDDVLAQVHPDTKPHPTLVFWFRHVTRGGILDKTHMSEERFVHYAFQVKTVQLHHEAGNA